MEPITIAIAYILTGAGGGLLGYLFGNAQAQAEIERLTKAVQEYSAIAKNSEQKVIELESKVNKLEAEIKMIKQSRNFFKRFLVFLRGEYPEVLERFRAMQENKGDIEKLKTELNQAEDKVKDIFLNIKRSYPKEVSNWEKAHSIEFS